jgi:hypothetical protein
VIPHEEWRDTWVRQTGPREDRKFHLFPSPLTVMAMFPRDGARSEVFVFHAATQEISLGYTKNIRALEPDVFPLTADEWAEHDNHGHPYSQKTMWNFLANMATQQKPPTLYTPPPQHHPVFFDGRFPLGQGLDLIQALCGKRLPDITKPTKPAEGFQWVDLRNHCS